MDKTHLRNLFDKTIFNDVKELDYPLFKGLFWVRLLPSIWRTKMSVLGYTLFWLFCPATSTTFILLPTINIHFPSGEIVGEVKLRFPSDTMHSSTPVSVLILHISLFPMPDDLTQRMSVVLGTGMALNPDVKLEKELSLN